MKIRVLEKTAGCLPQIFKKGDWIDLRCAKDTILKSAQKEIFSESTNEYGVTSRISDIETEVVYIPLGVAIQLPKGFEAIIAPRSSTPKRLGVICANSIGIIDNSYKGENDEWMFPAIALRPTVVMKGDRLCQFRIQLNQKASIWQKLKWLFSSKIEIEKVEKLESPNRKGLGKGTSSYK